VDQKNSALARENLKQREKENPKTNIYFKPFLLLLLKKAMKYFNKTALLFFLFLLLLLPLAAEEAAKEKPPKTKEIKLKVTVIAYCLNGKTSCGTSPGLGTIAVDPRVIPLGSKIYVPGYGWGKALDTGGNIKGKIIDIWLPTHQECLKWGRKTKTIKVIPNNKSEGRMGD